MTKTKFTCFLFLGFLFSVLMAQSQPYSLKGRSCIELNLGLWHESSAGNESAFTGMTSTAKTNGFIGGLTYNYWLHEYLSVSVTAGVLAGEATSTMSLRGMSQEASSVIPILLGVRYYVPKPSTDDQARPFLAVAVGPFMGFEAENSLSRQGTRSETSLGLRLGGGIDILVSQNFKLGANVGYSVMTDYSTPIGARRNYNGPDFSLGFGFIFGGSEP